MTTKCDVPLVQVCPRDAGRQTATRPSPRYISDFSQPDWLQRHYGAWIIASIVEIAERVETPFNLILPNVFAEQVQGLRRGLSGAEVDIRFGGKGWYHPEFLTSAARSGVCVCAGSLYEVELALRCGITPSNVVYMQPGADAKTVRAAICHEAQICLDSLTHVQACVSPDASDRPVRVSVRVAVELDYGDIDIGVRQDDHWRLGVTVEELCAIRESIAAHGGRIVELLGHAGSLINSPSVYSQLMAKMARIAEYIPEVDILNLGGGLPFGYIDEVAPTPLSEFSEAIAVQLWQETERLGRPLRVALEPARVLCAPAAIQVVRITDVKQRGGASPVYFCDGQMASLGINWPTHVLDGEAPTDWISGLLVGGLCSPHDVISTRTGRSRIGSLVAIGGVGAYAMPLAPASLQSRPRPREVVLQANGNWRLGRTPWTAESLLERVP
jgi:diaminopimelate decarboxylase